MEAVTLMENNSITSEVSSPKDPEVIRLLELLQSEYVGLYGVVDPDPTADLDEAGSIIIIKNDGKGIGMVAWTRLDESTAVMHRMYVHYSERGKGYSRELLSLVEESARLAGMDQMFLETGTVQTIALELYNSAGYLNVPAFGFYSENKQGWTTSVFMGKKL